MLQVAAADVMTLLMHFRQAQAVPRTELVMVEDPQVEEQYRPVMAALIVVVVVAVQVILLQIHLVQAARA
jgi:hypothetical protein